MISMSRCGCVPKPMPGMIRSSLITRSAAEPHPLRVVVVREAEGVIAVQPAVLGVAPFIRFAYNHHGQTMRAVRDFGKYHVSCLSITFRHTEDCMELRHLRYFVAVAEAENVSRAALKLHVSQPGVSRQIRDLEDEIGFQLFERSAKSVRLTAAGSVFLAEARAVLQRAEEAVAKARAVAGGTGGRNQHRLRAVAHGADSAAGLAEVPGAVSPRARGPA